MAVIKSHVRWPGYAGHVGCSATRACVIMVGSVGAGVNIDKSGDFAWYDIQP